MANTGLGLHLQFFFLDFKIFTIMEDLPPYFYVTGTSSLKIIYYYYLFLCAFAEVTKTYQWILLKYQELKDPVVNRDP